MMEFPKKPKPKPKYGNIEFIGVEVGRVDCTGAMNHRPKHVQIEMPDGSTRSPKYEFDKWRNI